MICKFCKSKNMSLLSAEGGLGGGNVKVRYYDDESNEIDRDAYLCEDCGRITLLMDC